MLARTAAWMDVTNMIQFDKALLIFPVPAQNCERSRMIEDFSAPPPYRRVHDHDSVRSRFPALVPCSQPRVAGVWAHRAVRPPGIVLRIAGRSLRGRFLGT